MIIFDEKYFKDFNYLPDQSKKYLDSAYKDLNIAKQANVVDVKFQFSYNAMIKLGICLAASYGKKVNSRAGHHIKIIEVIASVLDNNSVAAIGNQMRKIRNTELYDGGKILITKKQASGYCDFTESLFKATSKFFKQNLNLLF